MYPSDSITLQRELIGDGSVVLVNNTNVKYILGFSLQQSGVSSETTLYCGTTTIAINYGKDFGHNVTNFRCEENIIMAKTGQDSSSLILTYVERDLSTQLGSPLTLDPNILPAITDLVSGVFVFWTLLLMMIAMFIGNMVYRR